MQDETLTEGPEEGRTRDPIRKSVGPSREKKQRARRTSRRKQGGTPVVGMHRRGSKRRTQ